jgi:hypothetical protein
MFPMHGQPKTSQKDIDRVSAFFSPANLAAQKIVVVAMDFELEWLRRNPEAKEAAKVAKNVLPQLRDLGLHVVHVITPQKSNVRSWRDIDLSEVRPERRDTIVFKDAESAIERGYVVDSTGLWLPGELTSTANLAIRGDRPSFLQTLHDRGVEGFALTGNFASECISVTGLHGLREKFKVCLIDDMIGDHFDNVYRTEENLQRVCDAGASRTKSGTVIKLLSQHRLPEAA